MTNYPYILFNKSPLQLRLIGARGGKACGRNHRLRRSLLATTPPDAVPRRAAELRVPVAAGVRRASTTATTTRRGLCAP
jgi:hypothetical protein